MKMIDSLSPDGIQRPCDLALAIRLLLLDRVEECIIERCDATGDPCEDKDTDFLVSVDRGSTYMKVRVTDSSADGTE